MNYNLTYEIVGHIVTETQVLHCHRLVIENGLIRSMEPVDGQESSLGNVALPYILPGFRDQHIHDLNGQLMVSQHSEEALVDRFGQTMHALARRGVTGVYIATFGDRVEHLEKYCRGAKGWMDHSQNGRSGAKLNGINIEGSFLNVECRGAQPAEYCLIPTRDDCIDALNRIHATGAAKLVNIVPDYGEPSLQVMRHAKDLGFLVGSGHLKPPADLLRRAYEECGLRYMVHFTNGPTGQSFKPFGGGGAFEGALHLPICKELIMDRAHIDERYVLDIIRRTEEKWGLDRIITVADALFPTPEEIPEGEFHIGSTIASKDGAGRCLYTIAYTQPDGSTVPAPPNTLCGSILTMDKAFSNLVSLFTQDLEGHWYDHAALSLDEAIVKASFICSTTQAKLDSFIEHTGSIAPGKAADIVLGEFTRQDREYTFNVQQVYVDGHRVIE